MSFLLSAEFPLEVVTALPLPPPWKCVDGVYYNEITGETNEKHPFVVAALERELDQSDLRQLRKSIANISKEMEISKGILGLE